VGTSTETVKKGGESDIINKENINVSEEKETGKRRAKVNRSDAVSSRGTDRIVGGAGRARHRRKTTARP